MNKQQPGPSKTYASLAKKVVGQSSHVADVKSALDSTHARGQVSAKAAKIEERKILEYMKPIDKKRGLAATVVLDMLNPLNTAAAQINEEEAAFVEALRKRTQLTGNSVEPPQAGPMLVDPKETLESHPSNNVQ